MSYKNHSYLPFDNKGYRLISYEWREVRLRRGLRSKHQLSEDALIKARQQFRFK